MKTTHKQNSISRQLSEKIYTALEMERRIIGIKLFRTEEEYRSADIKELNGAINYCQMAAAASRGHAVKSNQQHIKCSSGIRSLGFDHADLLNSQGENWVRLGLYEDPEVSRKVRGRIEYIPEKTHGILLQPLEYYDDIPDVIMIVTTPYNVMRLTQGYAYHYGTPEGINMIGNQAVCLECTAFPYVTGNINISTLCIGTRHQAGWKDTEMAVSIPAGKFTNTVAGVVATINIMESDAKKKAIENRARKTGIEIGEIKYHYNYYMDC